MKQVDYQVHALDNEEVDHDSFSIAWNYAACKWACVDM